MDAYIYFNSRDTFFRIELSRIAYFEADRNYTNLFLTNGQKLVFSFGIGIMKDYLLNNLKEDAAKFVRIGKSLIINIQHLYQIDILKQQILLYDKATNKGFALTVSKEAAKTIKGLFITNNEYA